MTNYVEGIDRYYDVGTEIVCFGSKRDLVEKIRYYLSHEEEREAIARRGYERTLRDHTYEQRFNQIFEQMGLVL